MIVDLPDTTTSEVTKALVRLRDEGGAVALGRVLTLVIDADARDVEDAVAVANDVSREHPARIIVLARHADRTTPRLDGQIRVGGDGVLHVAGVRVDDQREYPAERHRSALVAQADQRLS